MINIEQFEETIRKQINETVEIEITNLLTTSEWSSQIRAQAIAHFVRSLRKELDDSEIDAKIREYVSEIINRIEVKGIDVRTDDVELTVMPGMVVAENDFAANTVQAVKSVTSEDVFVHGALIVKGSVNTDGSAWGSLRSSIENKVIETFNRESKKALIDGVLDTASKQGIEFNEVKINGMPVLSGSTLSPVITASSLQSVGNLKELTVLGEADFNNTVFVANKRLGINTREPNSVLSIWDEECEVSIGKHSEQTSFIGSTRKQNLKIGVNNKGAITIDHTGLVTIDQLQVGKQKISHGSDVPGYSGTKGDIVFNINIGPKNPVFAWMCTGSYNWVALSASIS